MNRVGGWAAAIGLLLATGALVAVTPADPNAPIEVGGAVGERITARTMDATVLDVRLTDRIDVAYEDLDGSTPGVWLVVDAEITPTLEPITLDHSFVRVGGVRYEASPILGIGSMLYQRYGAGVTQRGPIVFELPLSALTAPGAGRATIVLLTGDGRLDSLPAVTVDLTALEPLPRIGIDRPVVAETGSGSAASGPATPGSGPAS